MTTRPRPLHRPRRVGEVGVRAAGGARGAEGAVRGEEGGAAEARRPSSSTTQPAADGAPPETNAVAGE